MDFNQIISPDPVPKSRHFIGLIVAIVVVLVIVALFVILSRNMSFWQVDKNTNSDGFLLDDEEKIKILNQISAPEYPLSDEEKIKVLEQVGSGAQETPFSDEEKIKILNSL